MAIRIGKYPIVTISGALVIIVYCIFTLISWAFYPDSYGPSTHYLSRLGNYNYNPFGAYFYNWGCILTGILLFPFFYGLYIWCVERYFQGFFLLLGLGLGFISGGALMFIGYFSEDQGAPHMTSSSWFFTCLFFTLILLLIALFLNPNFNKIIGIYGLGITLSSLYFALTVGGPLTEWYSVFGSLLFVGLLSWNTLKAWDTLNP